MQLQAGIICAFLGATISFSFGLWTESLTFLLVLMAIDYFTGVAASIKEGSGLNSNIGFWGLFKKALILLVMIIAHRLDVLLGAEIVMGSAVFFYIANELLSVIENYGRLGLPLPDRLKKIVQVLRDRAGEPKDPPDSPEPPDPPIK
ncbi:phage holin family protein [Cohnella lupini]|uniref:Toxin secretion/phage lysis holin n=1 Tax=Cohnella lupini TaxID=1294267 RepID=A0A3D9IUY7_9BACL|nr:phage holin family protein [Cohnella lupini]RED65554.1 toxin secretion/phage lysis holin [Cohnella lupini]